MLRDSGASERIDLPWTMTSWAGLYVSTTRRGSSGSPMCLRDWSTSLCIQCEKVEQWEGCWEVWNTQPAKQTVVHLQHLSLAWTCIMTHMHNQPLWYTILFPVKRRRHETIFEEEIAQHYYWDFLFLLQNETTIHNKEKCTVLSHLHDLPVPFLFPLRVILKHSFSKPLAFT